LTPIPKVADRTAIQSRILRYCSACVLVLLMPVGAFPQSKTVVTSPTQTVTDSVDLAKKSVAPVVCLVRDAATGTQLIKFQIIGTAFMIEQKGMFITASHVISGMLASPSKDVCKPAITFPVGGWKRDPQQNVEWFSFDAGACRVNSAFDVAVCRTTEDMSKYPAINFELAIITTARPQDGTAIFFTGFPLQATDPITSIGSVAGYPADNSYSTVIIDKNAWPGASGSPIYLSDGNTLIGMVTRTGTGDAAGLSFGIAGDKISAILADAKAHWEEEQKKSSETPSLPATQR
jgi:Trypsin-like peptidase domain